MKTFLVIVFLSLLPSIGICDTLYLGLVSHHFNKCDDCKKGEWNERHNLIGYSTDKWMVVHMTNSYHKPSLYVGRRWWYDQNPYVRPYLTLGLATGYTDKIGIDIGPLATAGFLGVEFHTKDERFGVNLAFVPGTVVAVGFKFGL